MYHIEKKMFCVQNWILGNREHHSMNDEIGRPGALFPYSGRKRPHITLEVLGLEHLSWTKKQVGIKNTKRTMEL